MWTIFGCKWHFPLWWHNICFWQQQEVPGKKKINKKNPGVAGRWSVLIMRPHLSLSCIFWTNDLTWIIVKTWEKYIFSLDPTGIVVLIVPIEDRLKNIVKRSDFIDGFANICTVLCKYIHGYVQFNERVCSISWTARCNLMLYERQFNALWTAI